MSDGAVGIFCCIVVPLLAAGVFVYYQRSRRRDDGGPPRYCPWCGQPNRSNASACRACRRLLPAPAWMPPQPAPTWATAAPPQTEPQTDPRAEERAHIGWLLGELERPEIRRLLDPASAALLISYYQDQLAAPPPVAEETKETAVAAPSDEPAVAVVPIAAPAATEPAEAAIVPPPVVDRSLFPEWPGELEAPAALVATPPAPAIVDREPFRIPQPWKEWDSAVILLYLGAFLIVVAGLVYSSYSWEQLGGWQKVGLLALATAAFAGGGLALLPFARVRPAAETFIGIGAFLVPMNAIAVSNVSRNDATGPATVGEIGALVVTALYAFFSFRPGSIVYRYATVVAALIALALLPSALGAALPWGAPLVVLATAVVADAPRRLRGRPRRFASPIVHVGLVVLPVATVVGVAGRWTESVGTWWIVAATLAAASLSVARLALRRGDDRLAWLWTALTLAAGAALLAALDRPLAAGTVACVLAAAAWLILGERGPVLARRPPNRTVLHAEAAALLLAAPFLTDPNARPLLFTLAWVAAAAGVAAIACLRAVPEFGAVAAVLATVAYLSLGNLVEDTDLYRSSPLAILLAPAPLLLAVAAFGLGRRLAGARGRRWSLPVWAVAAAEAVLVTAVAAAELAADFDTNRQLSAAAVCLVFAVAGAVGARVLRWSPGLLAVALWLAGAVAASLFALPIADERRLPLLVFANLILAGFAFRVRFGTDWDLERARRQSTGAYLVFGAIALAAMVAITAPYVFDRDRPPASTSHPETGWWWPYLATYALVAGLAILVGRRVDRRAVWPASVALAATGMLGLRMAYGAVDVAPWRWPPIVVALAGGGAALAVLWRPRHPFDRVLRVHLIGLLAGFFGLPALAAMAVRTAGYALERHPPFDVVDHPAARWWWPDLLVYLALIGVGWWLGRRRDLPLCATAVAAGLVLGEMLALRLLYGNVAVEGRHWWPLIGSVGLATAVAVWIATRGDTDGFSRAMGAQGTLAGGVVGLPAVVAMLVTTAGYVIDLDAPYDLSLDPRASWWWPFVGFYAVATLAGGLVGPRLRRLDLSPAVATSAVAGLLLLLRMAYAVAPFDRSTWLPLLTLAGAATAAGGLAVRRQGSGRFGRRLGTQVAGAGAVMGVIGLVGSVAVTIGYIVDATRPFTVAHAEDRHWWWRFLALHLAVAVAAWVVGRRSGRAAAGPIVVAFGALALWLLLRMATTDLVVWTYAGMVLTVALAARRSLDHPRGESPFLTSFRLGLDVGAIGIGAFALAANLGLGAAGEGSYAVQAIVYALLCATIFGFSLWERQPLLTYGAVLAAVVAACFAVAAFDAGAANAGYAFAAMSWLLAAGSLTIPTTGCWSGQRVVWEWSAFAVAALPVVLGLGAAGALDPGEPGYQRLVLAILSAAGVLALTAVVRRNAVRGYAASVIALVGVLMQIAATEPVNVQAYTVPVSLYLLGLGWIKRRDPRRFDAFVGAGAALLMFPSFAQSFGDNGYAWSLLCGAEALLFVFLGLALGRRLPVAAGVVGLTAIVLRESVDYVHSLPTWAILAVVGIILLGAGTLWLAAGEELRRRFEELQTRWEGLR